MLDGKCYYAVFPDENPELRPRIRAVLDALANVNNASDNISKHFSQKISTGSLRPANPTDREMRRLAEAEPLIRDITRRAWHYSIRGTIWYRQIALGGTL
jgi:hypothetical protein